MRRTVNEHEKKLIIQNRKGSLTIFNNFGNGLFFWAMFLSTIVVALIIVTLYILINHIISQTDTLSEIASSSAINLLMIPLPLGTAGIITPFVWKQSQKRDINRIFNGAIIDVNGATVIDIDVRDGCFTFVEDDFINPRKHSPYAICYPLDTSKPLKLSLGERIMVIRTSKDDYIPMKLNENTRHLIPCQSSWNLENMDFSSFERIPHPNITKLEPYPRALTTEEKKSFFQKYSHSFDVPRKVLRIISGLLILISSFFSFMALMAKDVITNDSFGICLILFMSVTILLITLVIIGTKNMGMKMAESVSSCQTVILNYCTIDSQGFTEINVFELNGTRLVSRSYKNARIEKGAIYGTILQKYTCKEIACFFTGL